MSTIAGAFTETQLLEQRVRAEAIMFDDRIKQQYIPSADVLKALYAVQTANVLTPIAKKKDTTVAVEWMNTCDMEEEANGECEIGGTKSSTNTEEYVIEREKVVNFSASEVDFIDNDFDISESISKQFLTADKLLTEGFAAYFVAQLNAFAGVNATAPEGKGDITGAITFIDPAYLNADLFAYLHRVRAMNRFASGSAITSGNILWEQAYLAAAKQGNANGSGDAVLFNSFPHYFDLFNIDTVNAGTNEFYMLSTGSVAQAWKTYNPDSPQVVNGVFTRYTMPSQFMPNVKFDVFYKPECSYDMVIHNFKVKLTADIFNNPAGCSATNTGVLRFRCGTP